MNGPTRGILLSRALRLQCPRCGEERMFAGWFRMHSQCRHCGLRYEREPGYFLGSIYVNYALTALITTAAYITLRFGFEIENRFVLWPLAAFCVLFPMFFFRHARAWWLAMDLSFDRAGHPAGENEEDPAAEL